MSKSVEAGNLSDFAKVSTVAAQESATRPHVICVYCPDHRDRTEVMRVRERLRALGFERKIHFKADEMTERGQAGSLFSA